MKKSSTKSAAASAPESTVDSHRFAENMAKASELWQRILQTTTAHRMAQPVATLGHTDPVALAESAMHMARHVSFNPNKLAESQLGLARDHMKLWQWWTDQMLGRNATPTVEANPKDRRFADAGWANSSVFDFIKQNYLINARWLQDMVHTIDGLDAHTAHKFSFFTRQFVDAMAPSNFVFTNPEVMRTMIETNGESVVSGLTHLLNDLEKAAVIYVFL